MDQHFKNQPFKTTTTTTTKDRKIIKTCPRCGCVFKHQSFLIHKRVLFVSIFKKREKSYKLLYSNVRPVHEWSTVIVFKAVLVKFHFNVKSFFSWNNYFTIISTVYSAFNGRLNKKEKTHARTHTHSTHILSNTRPQMHIQDNAHT